MVDLIDLFRDTEYNHSESDTMQVLGLGELPPPACCIVCGNGNSDAGYLNFGIWAEFHGNIIVCSPCMVKAAEKVGCLAPSVNKMLHENLEKFASENALLREELDAANERLNAYDVILRTVPNSTTNTSSILDPDVSSEPRSVDDVFAGSSGTSASKSTKSAKSTKVNRLTTVDEPSGTNTKKQSPGIEL